MKMILTITLMMTTLTWVQGGPAKIESPLNTEHDVKEHSRFRREESKFMKTIKKLAGRNDYEKILDGANTAEQEALQQPNKAGLNPDQQKAVFFYTLENDFVYALNTKLKEKQGAGEFSDYVNLLMSALQKIGKCQPNGGTAWRVVKGSLNHILGEDIIWPAFSSTSADKDSVPDRGSITTLYKIEDASGYCIESYSDYPGEKEFLMPPNTKLEVMDGPTILIDTRYENQRQYTLRLIRLGTNAAVSISMTVSSGTWMIAIIVSYISDELVF
ncbi:uncharacterized protein LOC135469252 [Liolophura sinensis]|uniref:uncharacterized protein LOC135469252 n=1 Tax=Liolophura sinensis TaxID=3198878 RepID=UPI003158CDF2